MNPLILMALIGLPVFVLIMLLRVKSTFVFLSLCAGALLARVCTSGILDFAQLFIRSYSETTFAVVQLTLLGLPMLVSGLMLRRTVAGSKWIGNLIPALLTSVVAVYVGIPMFTPGTSGTVIESLAWKQLVTFETVLIGTAVFINLLQLWSIGRGLKHKKGKH